MKRGPEEKRPSGEGVFPWSDVLAWNSEQGVHASCPRSLHGPELPPPLQDEGQGCPGPCCIRGHVLSSSSSPAVVRGPVEERLLACHLGTIVCVIPESRQTCEGIWLP